jgi:hypothetical protein
MVRTNPSRLARAALKRLEILAASHIKLIRYPIRCVKNHRLRQDIYQLMTVSGNMPDAKELRANRQQRRRRIGREDGETLHGELSDLPKRLDNEAFGMDLALVMGFGPFVADGRRPEPRSLALSDDVCPEDSSSATVVVATQA